MIDEVDKNIIYALDQHARSPCAEIARRLKVSPDLVEDRLKVLEDSGVIKSYSVLVNPRRLGQIIFKVLLKLQGQKSTRTTVVNAVSRLKGLRWMAETYGNWDMCFSVAASTSNEFSERLRKLYSRYSLFISNQEVIVTTNVTRFPRNYLLEKRGSKTYLHLKADNLINLKTDDTELLKVLGEHGRASYITLANKLSSTPNKIKYRMKQLENLGVISGYRPRLDTGKLGIVTYKFLVERLDYSLEFESKFRKYCSEHHNITYLAMQLGKYSFEFDAEVSGQTTANALIDDLRERFDGDFRTIEPLLIKGNYSYRAPAYKDIIAAKA